MKKQPHIRASTLSEILVVLILVGIIQLSVFDGFSLFQRLLFRIQGKMEQSIEQLDGCYRLESLFMNCDSIRGEEYRMELYRQGIIRNELRIDDSLLIAVRPETEARPDTLLRRIVEYTLVRAIDDPERIDSLQLWNDTTCLRLGVRIRPESEAESTVQKIEQQYDRYENR